jgi:hypothetical protein
MPGFKLKQMSLEKYNSLKSGDRVRIHLNPKCYSPNLLIYNKTLGTVKSVLVGFHTSDPHRIKIVWDYRGFNNKWPCEENWFWAIEEIDQKIECRKKI